MSGMDIVKADRNLPALGEVADVLDALEASGDTAALNEVAQQARAYQEYERRVQATERAVHFGKIKVMAEARIGAIDLALHPAGLHADLAFGDQQVGKWTRKRWRALGAGLQGGQLEKAMRLAEARAETISTEAVVRELYGLGGLWVWTAPLLERYRELYEKEGLTLIELARRSGMERHSIRSYIQRPGSTPQRDKIARHKALRIATALGVDHSKLKGTARTPTKPKTAPQKPKIRPGRNLTGGRLDEAYSLIRKALQELDRATEGIHNRWGTDEVWWHLYEAEDILGRALVQAPASSSRSASEQRRRS
jgi:transcriptional regulator with XRE-family HTH domain